MCKALQDMKEERAQGREEGREEGQEEINVLYRKLKKAGRIEELMRAIDDEAFRKSLLEKEQNHRENG